MKIIELRAENIKNLKVVEIRPDGAVILEGKNGAGKSAVLDSIFMALTGKKIDEPIRNGEKRAEINVDLGTYKVKRSFTAKGDRLEVVSSEGAIFKSPQTMLNEILGNLSFDPLQFAEMGKTADGMRRQRAMLATLVGIDFTKLNKDRESLYNERTIKYRELKGGDPTKYRPTAGQPLPLEALVGGMEKPKDGTPRQEISMADAVADVRRLETMDKVYMECKSELDKVHDRVNAAGIEITTINTDITRLEKEIEALKEVRKECEEREADLEKQIEGWVLPEGVANEDLEMARNAILTIEDSNKEIRKAIEYDQSMARLENAKKEVDKLEDAMMKIDLEKEKAIKTAKFPIEGLGITDDYVTFNDKPFAQLSTGEQIRVSTAVAMALNPKLRVIIIREGSLLDKDGMDAIISMAKEKDFQCWIEKVQDKKGVGIYIEEGEIK